MKIVYFVMDEAIKGNPTWDTFGGAFETKEAAMDEAETQWLYLTERERKNRVVYVCHADVADDVALEDAYDVVCDAGDGWYVDHEFK